MQRLILKMTIAIAGLIGPIVQASELEKNELDEVVTFATNLGIYDCYGFKGAYDHPEMNQVYTVGKYSIYNIVCILGASNFGTVWFQRSGQGPLKPIYFAKPILSSSRVVGFETVNELATTSFDSKTNEISNHMKWAGHGDQSKGGTWKFEDGRFVLKEYHVDAVADQQVDPVTVFEGG